MIALLDGGRHRQDLLSVVLGAITLAAAGCATLGVRPHPTWTRPLCAPEFVPVTTTLDPLVARAFARIHSAAHADVPSGMDLAVVVADGRDRDASLCALDRTTGVVILGLRGLRVAAQEADTEQIIAWNIAHEIAHAALHVGTATPYARAELEADDLGVLFFERAGYDCRWVITMKRDHTIYRQGSRDESVARVTEACRLAKLGQRPPRLAR